jgi:hypothetical protein
MTTQEPNANAVEKYTPSAGEILSYVFFSLPTSVAVGFMLTIVQINLEQIGNFEGKSGYAIFKYGPPWIIAAFLLCCALLPLLIKSQQRFKNARYCLMAASGIALLVAFS